MDSMIKTTPLTNIHTSLGAKMSPFGGFLMPIQYSSIKQEHMAVRNAVGLFDVSHMGEFKVTGSRASALLQFVTSNDVDRLIPGQAQYSCFPNDQGGIVDDLIVYRMHGEEEAPEYMLVVNASNIDKDWNWIKSMNAHFGAVLENISDTCGLLALQGPKASEVLQQLTDVDIDAIKFYHHATGSVAAYDDVIISATGYTGSGGFELYVPNQHLVGLWHALMDKGQAFNIAPAGLGARDTLRLEMGYCLYGNDITDTTSPIEAGLSWITKTKKSGFMSRGLFMNQKKRGLSRKLMGFTVDDRRVARAGYEIQNMAGERIGEVTSGGLSPVLEKPVGMGFMPLEYQEEGREIIVHTGRKALRAFTKNAPFVQI